MPEKPSALMIFAAGFGTRMKQLTKDRPKPLIQVAGKPLIDHALDFAREAECAPIVANLHYRPEQLRAHLEARNVKCLLEEPHILDTGGGLRNALPLLGDSPVFTMNSDAIWRGPNALRMLVEAWNPEDMDALLMTVPLQRAVGRKGVGDFVLDTTGRLSRGPDAVYCGVQIIKTQGLMEIEQDVFSLNLLWDQMQAGERLYGLSYPGMWCDVGHPEGVMLAEDMLAGADV